DAALRTARPPAEEQGERRLPARFDRRRPPRSDEAVAGRPDHRSGVRERVQLRPPEQEGGRADRRHAGRAQGALRRRARPPARLRRAEGAEDRSQQGGGVADAVNEGAVPARATQTSAPLARPRPEPNVPRHRFGIAYLILAALLGTAGGLLVVLAADGGKNSGPAWSAWKPKDSGVGKLNEISKFVESEYALQNGRRLVLVLSTPPEVQSQGQPVPLRA